MKRELTFEEVAGYAKKEVLKKIKVPKWIKKLLIKEMKK